MINSKELRLGNLIYRDDNEEVFTVESLGEATASGTIMIPKGALVGRNNGPATRSDGTETCFLSGIPLEEAEGIPLTEEWLKSMGFRVMEQWQDGKPLADKRYHRDPMTRQRLAFGYDGKKPRGFFCTPYFPELNAVVSYPPVIDYIHQLQNLFFALYSEELTIKP